MSSMATSWAFDAEDLNPPERLVLLLLADCHDPSTGVCETTDAWLGRRSNMDRDELHSALRTLFGLGLINGFDRSGECTQYFLNIQKPRRVA